MASGKITADYKQIRQDLLEYSKRETFTIVKILEVLYNSV
nr:hypothetical protein [uncultured bacterium]